MASKTRTHVEKMLARAQRRRAQADRLVAKWTKRLSEIDRETTAQLQSQLWQEEDNPVPPDANAVDGHKV